MTEGSDFNTVVACRSCGRALEASGPCRHCGATRISDVTRIQDDTSSTADELVIAGETTVHSYRFGDEIARGGMGRVIRAHDHALRREVACKLLLRPSDPQRRLRFVAEAQITGQLEHPNIVPIHGLSLDGDGRPFFAMRLVRGDTLEQILDRLRAGDRDPRWELNRLLEHFIGVCNGIGFAHSRGVIHRDLKPSNVMTGEFGQVLVMDWGLAKVVGTERDDASASVRACAQSAGDARIRSIREDPLGGGTHTLDGEVMGTAAYMPPEQAAGRIDDLDERCDIYALGAILYEILCLHPPVVGENLDEVLDRVARGAIPPPEEVAPERTVPRELSAIAMKALAHDRNERYASVRDLRADVRAYLDHRPVSASEDRPLAAIRRLVRRNPAASAVGLVAVLLIAIGGAAALVVNTAARHRAEAAQASAEQHLADFRTEQLARERADAERIAVLEAQAAERERSWQLVVSEDFTAGLPDPQRWAMTTGWHDVTAVAPADFGDYVQATASGLRVRSNRNLHLALRDDVGLELRASLQATYHGGVDGGMHLTIGGSTWRRGYIVQIGGWRNSAAAILRGGGHASQTTELARTPLQLEVGRRYQVTVSTQRDGPDMHIRVELDGELLLKAIDPDPLLATGGPGDAFALWAANLPDTTWHRLTLHRLGEPLRVDLLATADRHLELGHFQTALDLFADVESAADDPLRRAAARAGRERARTQRDLHADLEEWRQRLAAAWPEAAIECYVGDRGYHLSLTGPAVVDLAILADMPLEELALRYTEVASLAPIRGQPLRRFQSFNSHHVVDLEPLRGMPIRDFHFVNQVPLDLTPLAGMPLETVNIGDASFSDLTPLQGAPIRELALGSPVLTDLGPIATLPLEELQLIGCPIHDLTPLADLDLSSLIIARAPGLTDLTPIAALPLSTLVIHECPRVTDLAAVSKLPLERLSCAFTGVSDLTPLRGLALRSLSVQGSPISDLTPLAGMPLQQFSCADTAVADLEALRGMPLTILIIRDCPVTDLGPLAGMPLREFECAGTAVRDLAPLTGAPLVTINLRGCAVSDLTPVANPELRLLDVSDSAVRDLRPLAGIPLQGLIVDTEQVTPASRPVLEALPAQAVAPDLETFHRRAHGDGRWRQDYLERYHEEQARAVTSPE